LTLRTHDKKYYLLNDYNMYLRVKLKSQYLLSVIFTFYDKTLLQSAVNLVSALYTCIMTCIMYVCQTNRCRYNDGIPRFILHNHGTYYSHMWKLYIFILARAKMISWYYFLGYFHDNCSYYILRNRMCKYLNK